MPNPQTTETTTQLLYGAVKVEISTASNMAGAVDLGVCNGVKYTEEMKITTLENDNAVDRDVVTEQKGMIEFTQMQFLNVAARAIMRGTLETVTPVAGVEVAGDTQVVAATWTENKFYEFEGKQATGVVPSAISIADIDGAWVLNTDYHIVQNDRDMWGVVPRSTANTDPAKAFTITYTYTPAATIGYTTGGKTAVPTFYTRLTNVDENGKKVVWTTLGKCNITSGDELAFKKYNADDPRIEIPIKIQVRQDSTLTAGAQLMSMVVDQ